MRIDEAAKLALDRKCCMARRSWMSEYRPRIEPTDTPDCCIFHSRATQNPRRGWQPAAEDLIADDWYLLGLYDGSEFSECV